MRTPATKKSARVAREVSQSRENFKIFAKPYVGSTFEPVVKLHTQAANSRALLRQLVEVKAKEHEAFVKNAKAVLDRNVIPRSIPEDDFSVVDEYEDTSLVSTVSAQALRDASAASWPPLCELTSSLSESAAASTKLSAMTLEAMRSLEGDAYFAAYRLGQVIDVTVGTSAKDAGYFRSLRDDEQRSLQRDGVCTDDLAHNATIAMDMLQKRLYFTSDADAAAAAAANAAADGSKGTDAVEAEPVMDQKVVTFEASDDDLEGGMDVPSWMLGSQDAAGMERFKSEAQTRLSNAACQLYLVKEVQMYARMSHVKLLQAHQQALKTATTVELLRGGPDVKMLAVNHPDAGVRCFYG